MPIVEDCVDQIGSAKFGTKLDLLKGYWQVTPDRFLQYTVMDFGLKNAPATFQPLMTQVLGDISLS